MPNYSIQYTETLSEADQQRMEAGHVEYEAAHDIAINFRPFAFVLKNDNTGETHGVLNGYCAFEEIYIDDLWVDAAQRRQGYGKQLIAALEKHFANQGYQNINLVTNAFQAPAFYQKCGFEVEFTRVHKSNPKLTKTFFIKYLT